LITQSAVSVVNITGSIKQRPLWAQSTESLAGLGAMHDIESTLTPAHCHSQVKEDIRMWNNYFYKQGGGSFLEMGALDGTTWSNTLALQKDAGWKGVLIEGEPSSFKRLQASRPDQVLVNAAVCRQRSIVHYTATGGAGSSGIWEFMSDEFRKKWHPAGKRVLHAVPCFPLTEILTEVGIKHFNLFSLDVEGAELEILQTLDFHAFTFDLIVVEAGAHSPEKNRKVHALLDTLGLFDFQGFDGANEWWKRKAFTPHGNAAHRDAKPLITQSAVSVVTSQTKSTLTHISGIQTRLHNFCIDVFGSIVLLNYDGGEHIPTRIATEYGVSSWSLLNVRRGSPAFQNLTNITLADTFAAVLPFGHLAGWHLLHVVLSASKVREHWISQNSSVVFFVKGQNDRSSRLGSAEVCRDLVSSNTNSSCHWQYAPLADAILGKGLTILPYSGRNQCYRIGDIGGPRVLTQAKHQGFPNQLTTRDLDAFVSRVMRFHNITIQEYCPPRLLMTERAHSRRILNWGEVSEVTKQEFPELDVLNVRWEQYPMREQFRLATTAVGLVGMHGANLQWVVFAQKGGILIKFCPSMCDMFQTGYNNDASSNYGFFARLRGLDTFNYKARQQEGVCAHGTAWRNCDVRIDPKMYRKFLHSYKPQLGKRLQPFLQCQPTMDL